MTTLNEISKKIGTKSEYDFFPNMMNIDIGNYEFTDMRRIGEFTYLYTNKNDSNIALVFNEDRQAVTLYELISNNNVKVTTWRMGKKFEKVFGKEKFEKVFER